MSKKIEELNLVPLKENELGQIEGGYAEVVPAEPSNDLSGINVGCPTVVNNSGCPTPTPSPAKPV
jgi:hypothetical protein